MKSNKHLLLKALKSRYQAQVDEAKATIAVYSDNAVGIGEHPQVVEEMAKQVDKLAAAEDSLNALKTHYGE